MPSMSDVRTLATGLDHPEGVALGPDGRLYAGGEAGQVYRVDADTGDVEQIAASDGGFMLGLCLDATGALYVCDAGRRAVLRLDASGQLEPWCEAADGVRLTCPNWPAFAPDGSLYVSDSGPEDPAVAGGRIVRVPPGGGDAVALDLPPLHFPNGLALAGGETLVVLESFLPRLVEVSETGLHVLAELPGRVPDGVALDADGGYVVSCYYPYHVYRVPPEGGAPDLLLDDATGTQFPMPTNVCFFGEGLSTLAVAALGGSTLSAVDIGLRGAPLHYPAPHADRGEPT
jgi:gluconolactonase